MWQATRQQRSIAFVIGITLAVALLPGRVSAEGLAPGAPAQMMKKYERDTVIPFPVDNAYTKDRELLGRMLFFDPRLSGSNFISCATCHNPAFSWGDGLPKGIGDGMKQLGRRTPTILNLAWVEPLFWDGRAADLEAQALGPIESPAEMNQTLDEVLAKLKRIDGYQRLFTMAYPGEGMTPKTLAKALATFERTVVSGIAPFDDWIAGKDDAISNSAKRGFVLFNTKGNCAACHQGWSFTDGSFHDVGMPSPDIGRGKILPTIERMQHAFKTPTLRNVDHRGPYMHDGSVRTLEDAVRFYNDGFVRRASLSREIRPLGLTPSEVRDIATFLRTLTSNDPPVTVPVLPR
jgi:cytochrome c peroxidase